MSADPVPPSIRWSVLWWLAAVAAGVVETVIQAMTSQGHDAAVQLPVRAVVYLLVAVAILQLNRGRNWARIVLTVVLGGLGLLSLLVEPVSWLAAGGSPGGFLAAADGATLAVVAVRATHVVAVLVALVLMYRPAANRFFRRALKEQPA